MSVFSTNLKRFRMAKNMTQEQAAEALGVSTQTVSRWECNTTLPDVTILPKIAALYCVTIDDLYKETSVAYDNYASRLSAVFESTRRPEDFMQAEFEYRKLLKSREYTTKDLRLYGVLHQHMMNVCKNKAEELFDQVINKGGSEDPETYWHTQRQKISLYWQIGRNHESIHEFLTLVEAGSNELQEWICLIQSYFLEKEYDSAWVWVQKAQAKFQEDATLHVYAGDLMRTMKRYDEAFLHWKRALEMDSQWLDAAFSMGSCYEELGEYDKAYAVWTQVTDILEQRGFQAEVNYPRSLAQKCRDKIST